MGRDWAAADAAGEQFAGKKRAWKDEQAFGGLRKPHLSIRKLKGSSTAGKTIRRKIDSRSEDNYEQRAKALGTLGKERRP